MRAYLVRLFLLLLGCIVFASPGLAALFVVDSAGLEPDENLGDNLCHTAANTCTLPAAISESNATLGSDTIQFAIPGAGLHTIAPVTALPPLLEAATLDATTQPGYAGTPLIELDGTAVAAGDGIVVSTAATGGGSVVIRGLTINRFPGSGVLLQTGQAHVIQACYIGTDATGVAAAGNGSRGVDILVAASDVTVGGPALAQRNVISGNAAQGVSILSDNNFIQGNYVGTDVTGTIAVPNGTGVQVFDGSDNVIGGLPVTPGAPPGNVISGNTNHGISVNGGNGTHIAGNLIGTTAAGDDAVPNLGDGVNATVDVIIGENLFPFRARAGGSARNVISGNGGHGVEVRSDSVVAGNYIGTDITGGLAIGNGAIGLRIFNSTNATFGGPSAGNLISANALYGIEIAGSANIVIQSNRIGTDVSGLLPLPNANDGIAVTGASSSLLIGGLAPDLRNTIAFNGGDGIAVNEGIAITISANSIFENAALGIDLSNDGATPNDVLDPDTGPNELQNFPVLANFEPAAPVGTSTRVVGRLHSAPSSDYFLHFYSNPPCLLRPHDFYEGKTYLGLTLVTTDAAGEAVIDVTLPVTVPPEEVVTMTATNDSIASTSEFSQRLPFSISPRSGPSQTATPVTIAGTDFETGAGVTIGGLAATDVNVDGFNQVTASTPLLSAGTVNDLTVTNTDGTTGTLENGYVSDFLDVPPSNQFYLYVTRLIANGIAAGTGGGLYGVNDPTLRQQMAVFLLRAKYGLCYTPPPCVGLFPDVPCPSLFAPWIEALFNLGITGGCGGGNFCPQNPVLRQQMAVFLLKALLGSSYTPPLCAGLFPDVACPSLFADWIEDVFQRAITGGCGGGLYCPLSSATRGQMATFVSKTFDLQ